MMITVCSSCWMPEALCESLVPSELALEGEALGGDMIARKLQPLLLCLHEEDQAMEQTVDLTGSRQQASHTIILASLLASRAAGSMCELHAVQGDLSIRLRLGKMSK